MTTTTVPETLREAADHIERVGLTKGEFFKRPERKADGQLQNLDERPCCTMGAIGLETGYYVQEPGSFMWDAIKLYDYKDDEAMALLGKASTPEEDSAAMRPEARPIARLQEATRLYLAGYLSQHGYSKHVPSWNDDEERTAKDVVTTLRAAADAYVVEGV